jgi:subtilisin family serine protease
VTTGARVFVWLFLGFALLLASPATAVPRPDGTQILVMLRTSPEHFRPNSSYGGGYGDGLAHSARARLARRIARDHRLTLIDDWPMPLLDVDCFVMRAARGSPVEASIAEVSRDPAVAWAEPMHTYVAQGVAQGRGATPNDPLYPAQPAKKAWRLDALHRMATGRGVTVAVIDSAIDARHPDLAGQLSTNRNFVTGAPATPERHGTGVAGIIAARADNHVGIVGVAPGTRVMGLRACWQDASASATLCDTLSLAKALHFAIEHDASVINLSLSGPRDLLLSRLLDIGLQRGAVIVAARDQNAQGGGFPASEPGVIAVASEGLSPAAAHVYTAPGRDIPTTAPGGRWTLVDGNSYAAAHVSGLAALIRERRPRAGRDLALIAGRGDGGAIDAYATLARQLPDCDGSCGRKGPIAADAR